MIKFDCYDIGHKNPVGAVRCREKLFFSIEVDPSLDIEKINAVMRNDKDESSCFPLYKKDGTNRFEGDVILYEKGVYKYRFELVCKKGNMYFVGTVDGHTAKIGDWLSEWTLAVYDQDFHTCNDVDGAVMYQIFPDRFFKADIQVGNAKNQRIVHEKWDERPHCFYDYQGFKCNDFFMGNLKGIEQKLDYISSLGVTHLYLNPIFESSENHRYSTSDYMNIDPYLGDSVHFKNLCEKAKEYDIKIILDGVFSHTGDDSIYFNRYGNFDSIGAYNSKESPYYEWYDFKEYPDKYECWWGFDTLPNVKETNPSYMEYITGENGVLRHWLRMGASGWRLDVADELPDEFLEAVRKAVKAENPDALIIGEVWENAIRKHSYGAQREFLLGRQCDSVMNYPFLNAITDYVINSNAENFYNSVMQIISDYPAESVNCLMNMMSTHDTARALCRLGAVSMPERKYQADAKLSDAELEIGIKRFEMAAVLQFTLPGIPCIYYGD